MVAYRVALLILYGKALSLSFLAFAVSLTPRVSMFVCARAPRTRSSGMGNSFSFGERSLDGSSECERVSQQTCERAQATRKHSFVPRERTEFVWNDCGARLKFESSSRAFKCTSLRRSLLTTHKIYALALHLVHVSHVCAPPACVFRRIRRRLNSLSQTNAEICYCSLAEWIFISMRCNLFLDCYEWILISSDLERLSIKIHNSVILWCCIGLQIIQFANAVNLIGILV